MILTRLGNKRKMKEHLYSYFPEHKMRIELFFGAGGSYFYLPEPKYSILNDLDDDVTNLYHVIKTDRKEFEKEILMMPITQNLIKYWKNNQESDPIKKALRFILLSNFTYLGKGDTLRLGLDNTKRVLIKNIEPTFLKLQNTKITNDDFRNVIPKISFSKKLLTKKQSFVYLDPVYLDTEHYYKVPKWTETDTLDCFKIMQNSGINCAMSEFDNEMILDFASDFKMKVNYLKNRTNIRNRRNEILITNYNNTPQLKIEL
ncbi:MULTISPECIES: hypothetical protein [Flavobacterium]|uniref:Site-specific DNA-methyltransferase (adenine-specific) n=1 Tax=Flavobacterium jumunjinense TaxID=998845 RepID=A0ABV5GUJ0_9FLAO|nr:MULTISPECIES: hypothetical protein [Flavobacterium]